MGTNTVSYTHLDVYKRQVFNYLKYTNTKTPHIIKHRHSHGTVRCPSSRCQRPLNTAKTLQNGRLLVDKISPPTRCRRTIQSGRRPLQNVTPL